MRALPESQSLCTTPRGPETAAVASCRGRMAVLQMDHATTNRRVRRKHHAQATGRLQLALRCLQEHVPAWRIKPFACFSVFLLLLLFFCIAIHLNTADHRQKRSHRRKSQESPPWQVALSDADTIVYIYVAFIYTDKTLVWFTRGGTE